MSDAGSKSESDKIKSKVMSDFSKSLFEHTDGKVTFMLDSVHGKNTLVNNKTMFLQASDFVMAKQSS